MPAVDRLTDKQIKAAKPKDQPFKLWDGGGLFLLVQPHGSRLWRYRFTHDGKERLLALGEYPVVSLSAARARRLEARRTIADGRDPVQQRRMEREARAEGSRDSFSNVAADYFAKRSAGWSANHKRDVDRIINVELIPAFGAKAMRDITVADVRKRIEKIVDRGAVTFAKDVLGYFRRIVSHYNSSREKPIPDVSQFVVTGDAPPVEHHAALPASEVGAFLRKLQHSDAFPMTRIALRLLMLTGLRTNELIAGRWSEIDTKEKLWRVPADRMKARTDHLVPLSPQALALIAALRTITGEGDLMFPNRTKPDEWISNMTILATIYRLGYKGRLTGHGFRSMLSTWANEEGIYPDAIERQLAHSPRDKVRAAYNNAQYLPERRELMDRWATFLDAEERDDRVASLRVANGD